MIKRVLLIQLHHLGDVILATPAARAARSLLPGARIDFLTGPLGAQALEANPHIDNVLVNPGWRELRRARYDAVYDMHSVPTTAVPTFVTGAKIRVGIRGRGPRNLAYTKLLEKERGGVYMARQKMRLLHDLGVKENLANASLVMTIRDEDREWAASMLQKNDMFDPVVAISPVAKHQYKQWGAENWAAVADAIAEMGASVLISSGPGEEAQAEAVVSKMKQPALWQYGRTTVRQLAAIYEQCTVWVGNDGGPKHIAVAAGTPTVTVYRETLGSIWSDHESSKQIAINSGTQRVDTVPRESVLAAAVKFLR